MIDAVLLRTPQYRSVTMQLTQRAYNAMDAAIDDAQHHAHFDVDVVTRHFLCVDHVTSGTGCMFTLFPDVVRLLYWGIPTLHTRTAAGKMLDAIYSNKDFADLHAKTKYNLMASLAAAYDLLTQQMQTIYENNTLTDVIEQTAAKEAAQQAQAQSQASQSQASQAQSKSQAQARAIDSSVMNDAQGVAQYADKLQAKMQHQSSDSVTVTRRCKDLSAKLTEAQRSAFAQQLDSMDVNDATSGESGGGGAHYDSNSATFDFDASQSQQQATGQSGAGTSASAQQPHSVSDCFATIKTFAKLSAIHNKHNTTSVMIEHIDAQGNKHNIRTLALANGARFIDALDTDGMHGDAYRYATSSSVHAIDATLEVMGALDAGYRAIESETSFGNGAYADMTLGSNIHKVPASMLHTVYAKEFQPMLYTRLAEGMLPNVQHISQSDKGHGPVIICADLSGSTAEPICSGHAHEVGEHNAIYNVPRIALIKALALLFYRKLRADGRTVILLPFTNQPLRYMEVIATDSSVLKQSLAERKRRLALFLSANPNGGTSFNNVLYRVTGLLTNFQEENTLNGADVIYITDGDCSSSTRKHVLHDVQQAHANVRSVFNKDMGSVFDAPAYKFAGVLPQFQKDIVLPDNTRIYGVLVAPDAFYGVPQSPNYDKMRGNWVFPSVHWPKHGETDAPCIFDCVAELGYTSESTLAGLRMLYEEILKRSVYDFEDTDSYVTL